MLASFAGTDGTLAAIFALVSLGMVLLALVAMYFRDPAFLTFSSGQALDVRMLELLRDRLPPELLNEYVVSLNSGARAPRRNETRTVGRHYPGEGEEIEEDLQDLGD